MHSSPQTLLQLYVSLVRPHFEHASQIWNTHLFKHIYQLKQMQKFALKMCFKCWNYSYSELLHISNLPCLADRRKFLNLCYLFKLVNNTIDYPNSPLTPRNPNYPNRQGRTSLFVQPYANSNSFLYPFLSLYHLSLEFFYLNLLSRDHPCFHLRGYCTCTQLSNSSQLM